MQIRQLNWCEGTLKSGHVYITETLKAGHVMALMCPDTLLQIRQNPVTPTVGLAVISLL